MKLGDGGDREGFVLNRGEGTGSALPRSMRRDLDRGERPRREVRIESVRNEKVCGK